MLVRTAYRGASFPSEASALTREISQNRWTTKTWTVKAKTAKVDQRNAPGNGSVPRFIVVTVRVSIADQRPKSGRPLDKQRPSPTTLRNYASSSLTSSLPSTRCSKRRRPISTKAARAAF